MFALNPGGGAGAKDGAPSQSRQNLWFFGQLGLYFAAIRGAYVFFSSREGGQALLE
jgi:hypothetical protein